MKKFLKKLKQVNSKDIVHIFLFLAALLPAYCLKKKRPHMWLVCEYGKEARDNGYWFYKYVRENHKEQDIVYAIETEASDAKKVQILGEIVPYGTFLHWIYYLAADKNISSHKGGKPNAAVCYLLEVYGILKNKRIFLQHGITKDLAEMFFYANTKLRLFICGAEPEYQYISDTFGYPQGYVVYTGFARFDALWKAHLEKKQIVFVPTWRRWLYTTSSNPYENDNQEVIESQYVKEIQAFLTDDALECLLEKYQYKLIFFPHRNMTSIFETMHLEGKQIRVETWKTEDIQKLMLESQILITDYSSVAMDFAYMEKPVLYYQFDKEQYRKEHFKEGYFQYEKNGFGPVVDSKQQLYFQLEKILENQGMMEHKYKVRMEQFFPLRDNHNCERIYQAIQEIK